MTTTDIPVYAKGDRVTHFGSPATVISGNEPDPDWDIAISPTITIEYDKAPRGWSKHREVHATEVLPLAEEA